MKAKSCIDLIIWWKTTKIYEVSVSIHLLDLYHQIIIEEMIYENIGSYCGFVLAVLILSRRGFNVPYGASFSFIFKSDKEAIWSKITISSESLVGNLWSLDSPSELQPKKEQKHKSFFFKNVTKYRWNRIER